MSDFENHMRDIIREEGELLQTDIKPELKDRMPKSWVEDMEETSISSKISRFLRVLEAEGFVELEGGHSHEGEGRRTNLVKHQG